MDARGTTELLEFRLADRTFALPALLVREVTRSVAIASLPKAPEIVEGVINVRGSILPVLDIRRRFGLPPVPVSSDEHFVIAESASRVVALRVDRAIGLTAVDRNAIESAAAAPGAEYVAGIAKLPDGLLVIHDLARFLSLEEAEQVRAALAGAPLSETPDAVEER